MRPSSGEVATALYGAWRLMRFDSKAMDYFDKSVDGFWKSFYAAVFWVPLMTILSFTLAGESSFSLLNILSVAMSHIAYLFVFPLVFLGVCNAMGWQKNFIGCIVALNWTRIFYACLLLPIFLLLPAFLVTNGDTASIAVAAPGEAVDGPSTGLSLFMLGLMLYALAYEVIIYSRSLELSIPAGFGVVILEMMIALVWLLAQSIMLSVINGFSGTGASG